MAAQLLDGQKVADEKKSRLATRVQRLTSQGKMPGLGTILVGEDAASARYVAMKHKDCAEIGIGSFHRHLPGDVSQDELNQVIDEFNANPGVDAYLIQLPLPRHLDEVSSLMRVDPDKDVDGLHPVNLGKLVMGADGPLPCTPNGILELLNYYGVDTERSRVVIVGRGLTIGRPLSLLLTLKRPRCNATVTVVHTGTRDISVFTKEADIVIAAAGQAHLIKGSMIRSGAAVVGAGTTFVDGKLLSDLDDDVSTVAGWVTPRIGGVGPMTRAMLLENAVLAAERHHGKDC
ncbi:MAG: bifunctional 5,10-methylenetetrahydrofolate dehydrogenase/5,10-methenyltetrahydrofolate cyclohydrolase [Actinomycetota bacterium]|nr:MAG: bifunctional 5,10-methylenetetrahydrofolate dehydrogenase/5,10-methenyltetrahydrofolate cyclohydrolase [Actinomycetota bacterium]